MDDDDGIGCLKRKVTSIFANEKLENCKEIVGKKSLKSILEFGQANFGKKSRNI
jgi:hypothetical protein